MSISKFRLYELSGDYIEAIESFVDGEEHSEHEDRLSALKDIFENKVINVVKYIKNVEAEHEVVVKEIARMKERADRLERSAESLKRYVVSNLESTGLLDPIKSPEFEIKLVKNAPSLVVEDETLIPKSYIKEKVVKSLDRKAILDDIKAGFDVDGCKIEQKKRLSIK